MDKQPEKPKLTAIEVGHRKIVTCKKCKHNGALHKINGACSVVNCKCEGLDAEIKVYENKTCPKCKSEVAYDHLKDRYVCRCGHKL